MSKSGWTDTEKAGIFFQIMEKVSPIPWDQLELPEGRTLKAVQMMVQKEKAKVKAAKNGGDAGNQSPNKASFTTTHFCEL
ncbi:Hypothetical protein R9X50_00303000 [Acrodontium crateriforme]|uniref:Uncharacterized protein n=1 Tax=Acrodontium crateriforme TaxID=150365 RepID=A0AAQ3M1X8_9PEZI|nr:Hypothetical protein R9X50_00303000 [Acrodontium crateriforme]